MPITLSPANLPITAVAGDPLTIFLTTTLSDQFGNPIAASVASNPAVSVVNGYYEVQPTLYPYVSTLSASVFAVSWSDAQTQGIANSGNGSWNFSLNIDGDGPYSVVAGKLTMIPAQFPGSTTYTSASVAVGIGTVNAAINVTLGASSGGVEGINGLTGAVTVTSSTLNVAVIGQDLDIEIPANTYDAYGAASVAQINSEAYAYSITNAASVSGESYAYGLVQSASVATVSLAESYSYGITSAASIAAISTSETYALAQAKAASIAATAASDPWGYALSASVAAVGAAETYAYGITSAASVASETYAASVANIAQAAAETFANSQAIGASVAAVNASEAYALTQANAASVGAISVSEAYSYGITSAASIAAISASEAYALTQANAASIGAIIASEAYALTQANAASVGAIVAAENYAYGITSAASIAAISTSESYALTQANAASVGAILASENYAYLITSAASIGAISTSETFARSQAVGASVAATAASDPWGYALAASVAAVSAADAYAYSITSAASIAAGSNAASVSNAYAYSITNAASIGAIAISETFAEAQAISASVTAVAVSEAYAYGITNAASIAAINTSASVAENYAYTITSAASVAAIATSETFALAQAIAASVNAVTVSEAYAYSITGAASVAAINTAASVAENYAYTITSAASVASINTAETFAAAQAISASVNAVAVSELYAYGITSAASVAAINTSASVAENYAYTITSAASTAAIATAETYALSVAKSASVAAAAASDPWGYALSASVNAVNVSETYALAQAVAASVNAVSVAEAFVVASYAPLASPALTGNPTAPTQTAGDNSTKIATDAFVTTAVANAIAGVNPAVAVQAATTQASDTSGLTYNNGASGIGATFTGTNNTAVTIDGYTFTTAGQRLLVKNDTQSPSGAFNGIYSLTQVQTAITPPIFTRATDYNSPSDMNNTGAIPVQGGTVNTTTSWLLTSQVVSVGVTPLTYVEFSANPATLAPLASPAFTGIPTAPTASLGTNSTQVATTAFTYNAVSAASVASNLYAYVITSAASVAAISTSETYALMVAKAASVAAAAASDPWGYALGASVNAVAVSEAYALMQANTASVGAIAASLPRPTGTASVGAVPVVATVSPLALDWGSGSGAGAVSSVFTRTGAVTAQSGDYASFYVPIMQGIVADGGITDNYPKIINALAVASVTGGQCPQLPPGLIGVGSPIIVPEGVTLIGSGYSNSPGGYTFYGTTLCPLETNTIAANNGVVNLSNTLSGIQNLNISAHNPNTGASVSYALYANGLQIFWNNVGLYGGSSAVIYGSSSAIQVNCSDFYARIITGSAYAIDQHGGDWQVNNAVTQGPLNLIGGPALWSNCHFVVGPSGTNSSPLIYDNGQQYFDNCYFDSVLSGASEMINRSGAFAPSTYTTSVWYQNATTAVTGIPIFTETTTAGAEAVINGGIVNVPSSGNSWNAFIYGALEGTICTDIKVYGAVGITVSNFNSSGLGQFSNNNINGVYTPAVPFVSQTTPDASINNYTGILSGLPNMPVLVTGEFVNGILFPSNGGASTTAQINFGTAPTPFGSAFTIEAWFKLSAIGQGGMIVSGQDFYLYLVAGKLSAGVITSDFSYFFADSVAVADTNWHSAALSYNGSNAYLFLDGILVNTDGATGTLNGGTTHFVVGDQDGGGAPFVGTIDEVRLSSTCRYTTTYTPATTPFTSDANTILLAHFDVIYSNYLPLIGGTMSGLIAMGGNEITGLASGSVSTNAATFGQIPVPANGYGIVGNTGLTPTPAVNLTYSASSLAASVALSAGTAASVMVTGPLSVGTWLVNSQMEILSPTGTSGTGYIMYLKPGSGASVSFSGSTSTETAQSLASSYYGLDLCTIATVRTPGASTIALWCFPVVSGTALIADNKGEGNPTGIVAVRIE